MVGVLIAGHGNFPTGAFSAVALVAGSTDNVFACDFVEGMSSAELKANMTEAIGKMEGEEVLILADLAGGTPNRTAVELKNEITDKKIRVIAGANLPAIMDAAFSCSDCDDVDELAAQVFDSGVEGVVDFDRTEEDADDVEDADDFGDGI